ncbi:MAG: ComEA family DNA-binding protein [Oscillospiraceae bacterium]|nr:ComEA family DNA-binding protein [Oscillospiraceae bacterium]
MKKLAGICTISLFAMLAGFVLAFWVHGSIPQEQFAISAEQEQPVKIKDPPASLEDRGKININTAGLAELGDLPGIGPALAGRIISWREENGKFGSIDDLLSVHGIGEMILEKLRPYAKV